MLKAGSSRLDTKNRRLRIASSAKSALTYLRLTGVFPYTYTTIGKTGEDSFIAKKTDIFIQCIFIILITSLFLFDLSSAFGLIPETTWLSLIERIEIPQLSAMAVGALGLIILRRKRLKNAGNSVLNAAAELLDVDIVHRGAKRLVAIQLVVSFGICCPLHVSPIIVLRVTASPSNRSNIVDVMYFARFASAFMYWSMECLLIYFLVVLRACIFAADRYLASAAMAESSGVDGATAALRRLVLRRQMLMELVAEINSLFAPLLIMSAGVSLSELLFSAFFGVSFLLEDVKRDIKNSIFYIYLMGWLIFHSVRFGILCWSCDAVAGESRGAVCRVHRVLSALPATAVRTRARLYEYSFALRNCPVKITAMGFFDVDLKLCLNMISGLATYLIILLQFRFTPPAKET